MTNCYLLGCKKTNQAIIIDPGYDSKRIIKEITKLNLIPQSIILTHAHGDHIGAVPDLVKRYNIPVYIHPHDQDLLSDSMLNLTAILLSKGVLITSSRKLKDQDKIKAGTLEIEVIHTPGHTRGGISLKCQNVIFSGDTLFQGSIGRTDLPGGSHQQLLTSIKDRLLVFPDDTIIYPGHGPTTNLGQERENNPFLT